MGSGEVLDTYLLFTSNGVSCVDTRYKVSRGRPTTNESASGLLKQTHFTLRLVYKRRVSIIFGMSFNPLKNSD